jgi:hypothetical protein
VQRPKDAGDRISGTESIKATNARRWQWCRLEQSHDDRRIAMATPVTGPTTGTPQASNSNDSFNTEFNAAFESLMLTQVMQIIQNVQQNTGTSPTELWND